MEFVDTHCHIHSPSYGFRSKIVADSYAAGVVQLVCVGTDLADSQLAVDFVQAHHYCFASIGIHPHEAKDHLHARVQSQFEQLVLKPKVVAVGECGLDYYYNHSNKQDQQAILRFQLALAQKHNLPLIFHVREAFDDFWPIFDELHSKQPLKGVLHSFTDSMAHLEQALLRGLYIGLNGIMTFTTDSTQIEMAKNVPLENLLLETDAPFLTPTPYRGTMCEPKHVVVTAEFLATARDESLEQIAAASTNNARRLFSIS